ncbi:hypothetical protein Hanom_Chr04g00344551 [Helianthus anomalus]
MQLQLEKVRHLEDFARDLCKFKSEKVTRVDLALREDLLEHIMVHKPYTATRAQFKNWSADDLQEEVERIHVLLKNPALKATPPNWKRAKFVDLVQTLKIKRMKEEPVAAQYGTSRQIARWSESKVVDTYKRLEKLRRTDPNVPRKPDYPPITIALKTTTPQQTQTSKRSSIAMPTIFLDQRKRQREMEEED